MKFKSRKDPLFIAVFLAMMTLMGWILYTIVTKENPQQQDYISLAIVIPVTLLLIYANTTTYYTLTPDYLKYKCSFISGKIKTQNIHSIVKNKTLWVGLKPALARNGLLIKYDKYEEIYISPNTNDSFITEILKHKPNIKIL